MEGRMILQACTRRSIVAPLRTPQFSFHSTPHPSSAARNARRSQQPRYQQQQQQQQYQHQHHEQQQQYYEQAQSSTASAQQPPSPLLLAIGGYYVLINAVAAGMFWYDKRQATTGGWRVPERQLQLTALLGGWGGGMWAMEQFRHKTTKKSFREPYFMAVAGNVLVTMGAVGALAVFPQARQSLLARFSQALHH